MSTIKVHGELNAYGRHNPPGTRKEFPLSSVPPKALDLAGYAKGLITVVSIHSKVVFAGGSQAFRWNAVCKCGTELVVSGQHFLENIVQSCGCVYKSNLKQRTDKAPTNRKDGVLPRSIKFMPEDLKHYGHKCPDYTGHEIGALTVGPLVHALLYKTIYKSPDGPGAPLRRKSKSGGRHRFMVGYFMCTCTCGKTVVRNTNYLRLRTKQKGTPLVHCCLGCARGTPETVADKRDRLAGVALEALAPAAPPSVDPFLCP